LIKSGLGVFNSVVKKFASPSEGEAEGGCGGNSAAPEPKRSPAALLVQSRTPQKSFLFLLEEKIRRAQIRKSEENFFVGWRASASGGGAASLVPFKIGSREVYNYSICDKTRQLVGVFFDSLSPNCYHQVGGENV